MKKINISDELLFRFLDNKTTPEETEKVLASLQDDENFREYLDIRKAMILSEDKSVDCDETDARKFVNEVLEKKDAEENTEENESEKRKRIIWITAIAAGLIILFSIVNPFQPENTDSEMVATHDSQQYKVELREQVFAHMATANYFEIISPSETLDVNRKTNDTVILEWETNAKYLFISILDEKEKTLFQSDTIKNVNVIAIPLNVFLSDSALYWSANLFFEDGENDVKKGVIKANGKK